MTPLLAAMPATSVSPERPALGRGLSAMLADAHLRPAREVRAPLPTEPVPRAQVELATSPTPAPARELGLVAQVRLACARQHRLAMLCGMAMGGVVPVCAYVISHFEAPSLLAPLCPRHTLWLLVAGALLFSATTLWAFGNSAFKHWSKAVGFAVIMEGVLIFSVTPWLTYTALAYLVCINAIATGARLALEDQP